MRELRVAIRSLRHSPGFAIAAIVTLAVSIAANTSVFSVLNAVLLNPLSLRHIPESKRVVVLYEKNPSLAAFIAERLSPRSKTIATWQHQAHAFSDLAYLRDSPVSVVVPGANRSEQTSGAHVSPNFFAFFGVHASAGRVLNAADFHKSSVVITNSLADKLFGHASAAIGHSLVVNGVGMRIAGVLRKDFELPSTWGGQNEYNPQVISLHDEDLATAKDQSFNFTVFARLRPGYDRQRAQSDLDAIAGRLRASQPEDYAGFSANVRNILDETVDSNTQQAVVVLQVAVAFVLLIACANVGNLLLTRAVARDKEIAVRVAIGAGRGSIVRQILAESCLISAIGGAIGIALTFAALRLITGMLPDVQGFHEIRVDVPVLLFTVVVSLLCAVLFALPAIWRSWGIQVNQTLNRSSRSVAGSSNRLRTMLSIGQVALSLILLVGAGLLLRSLRVLLDTDLGFEHAHITSIRVSLPPASYPDARLPAFNRSLLSAVQQVPGVQSAALSTDLPMRGFQISSFEIPGRQNRPGEVPNSDWSRTTADFFKAMGIQILAGRTYSEAEVSSDAPVVVINRKLALAYWPGQNPLGKTLKFADKTRQIIGVVANEHQAGPDTEQSPELYLPGFCKP